MRDLLFINGLSCGDRTQDIFVDILRKELGGSFVIHRPNLETMDRSSSKKAIAGIKHQFQKLKDPLVIGYSLGGLWTTLLAREGFCSQVILISPTLPTNMLQIDLTRLKLFLPTLITGQAFSFNLDSALKYVCAHVPLKIVQDIAPYFRPEPASLIRELAMHHPFLRLSADDCDHLLHAVQGLIISGSRDSLCPPSKQSKLARLLGFEQLVVDCGHMPQLGPHADAVLAAIVHFVQTGTYANQLEDQPLHFAQGSR